MRNIGCGIDVRGEENNGGCGKEMKEIVTRK